MSSYSPSISTLSRILVSNWAQASLNVLVSRSESAGRQRHLTICSISLESLGDDRAMMRDRCVRGIAIDFGHMPRSGDYTVYYDGHFVALQIGEVAWVIDRDTVHVFASTLDLAPVSVHLRCMGVECSAHPTV